MKLLVVGATGLVATEVIRQGLLMKGGVIDEYALSKYPPAKPGALAREPFKGFGWTW